MQNARRVLLRAVGQRVNPLLHPGSAFAAPCGLATPSPPTSNVNHASAHITTSALVTASSASNPVDASGRVASGGSNPAIRPGNPVIRRYSELLEAGSLQRDDQQLALVQELARMYDEICSYKARMDDYHRATAEHQARRLRRLQELLAEEEAEERRRKQQQQEEDERRRQRQGGGAAAAGTTAGDAGGAAAFPGLGLGLAGLGSWLKSALTPLTGAGGGGGGSGGDNPDQARARQAAVRREEVLRREIGAPPGAPDPPRGIYVWGSVGSGKSMLVSLFYQALMETAQLPASRWMHFNAAMLEVHSRLHHLDTERWRQRDERGRAHHQHHLQKQQQQQQQQQQGGSATSTQQLVAAAGKGVREVGDRAAAAEEEDGEEEEEHIAAAASGGSGGGGGGGDDLWVPEHLQGVFRHWDPKKDPEVQRQREAKAAMMAVRRHMRLARLGRNDPRTLAAANAEGLVRMAASFIRGTAGDPRSGWGVGSGPVASVLYFDEVQVTDVFSAVALKGLVEALTSAGCVLVCTSNRSPHELPRHGLHEDMWGHFVDTLLQRCAVHELSSPADYRRMLLEQGRANIAAAAAAAAGSSSSTSSTSSTSPDALWPPLARSYILPAGRDGTAELERLWHARRALQEGAAGGWPLEGPSAALGAVASGVAEQQQQLVQQQRDRAVSVPVLFGRSLEVARCSPCGGAAWFEFGELCGRPLGPADYVALSQRFHTVFLQGVPAMSMQVRDQARRFITLLDELYNARCVLVTSAEVPPEELFTGAEGQEPILDLEGLQFETAVEDTRLRRDVMSGGGVAPVASSPSAMAAAMGALGGAEERFAFRRAVSRLLEMQSPQYILAALALRQRQYSNTTVVEARARDGGA